MDQVWSNLQLLLHLLLLPANTLLQLIGLPPNDLRAWTLTAGFVMCAFVSRYYFGDWVLKRRFHRTTGTVISVDEESDVPSPRIRFRDRTGEVIEFESNLQRNRQTGVIGAAVDVIYDPLHSRRAREAGREREKLINAIFWYLMIAVLLAHGFLGHLLPDK